MIFHCVISRKSIPFCDCNLEATNFTILKKSSLYRLMVPFSNLGFMSFTSVGCANSLPISRLFRGPTWPLICFKVWYGASEKTNWARAWNNLRLCGGVLLPRCAWTCTYLCWPKAISHGVVHGDPSKSSAHNSEVTCKQFDMKPYRALRTRGLSRTR